MYRWLIVLLILGPGSGPLFAQNPESQYVRIYNLIQQADALKAAGEAEEALPKYLEAKTGLSRIQRVHPEWQPSVVNYRLRYLTEKIDSLTQKSPAPPAPAPTPATSKPPGKSAPKPPAPPTPPGVSEAQVSELQQSLRQLQAEKQVLEAKLREALSTQPAAVDPREFNQAQERIQTLLKENEVLKTGLEQEKKRSGGPELEQTRAALTNANTQLADTRATNQRLDAEKQALQSQLAGAITAAGAIHALRAENERLKQQLTQTMETNRATATRLAALESEKQVLRLERTALEMRLKQVLGKTADKSGNVARGPEAEQLRELERQRDQLQKQLNEAMFEVRNLKSRQLPPQLADLNREIESLRARVEVFEARAIPYSPEELALFQKPPALKSATPNPSPAVLPPAISATASNTFALMAEAERSFAARDYARAEENYRTLLLQNATNAALYANLAAVHLEAGQLDQAEQQLNAALAADPNDAHATALLGHLKFRQEKFDEAIEALNRAAKLNPRDADVQNLLGVALSQKGLRGPAEQAFRKAIVLADNHAGAHHNLAVFYATENPPNLALARFHYQKARSLGHEKNPDLEQLFTRRESAGAN